MVTNKGTNVWEIHRGLLVFQTSPIRCWKDNDWHVCIFKNPNLWLQRHFSMNLSRILMFLLLGIVYSERGSLSWLPNMAVTRDRIKPWKLNDSPRQFKVWQACSGEGMLPWFVPWQPYSQIVYLVRWIWIRGPMEIPSFFTTTQATHPCCWDSDFV